MTLRLLTVIICARVKEFLIWWNSQGVRKITE